MQKVEKIQLEQDEQVLIEVRKHWFVLSVQVLGLVILGIVPPVIYYFVQSSPIASIFATSVETSLLIALFTAWLLIIWMGLFNVWTNYYLDVWTVTNKRLIAVDQRGFFFRKIESFRLERLQDISVSINGIVATMLDFGTLEMETASETGRFKAHGLPKPQDLKALILSASDSLSAAESKVTTTGA